MKFPTLIFCVSIALFSCKKENNTTPEPSNNTGTGPLVKKDSSYAVVIDNNIEYAEGISHTTLNSTDGEVVSLKLDIYQPDNTIEKRPALMFIHGGGFTGGSKQQPSIINMGKYFASRGWVFFSIDYRLKNDFGTIPKKWADYATFIPAAQQGQYLAIYPAQRDAKAAMRWVIAHADSLNIDTNHISVGGGSAGAITAITVGISQAHDYRDELSTTQDSTLLTTNMGEQYKVRTIIDFWGSKVSLDALEQVYGHNRFNKQNPPLMIAHGTDDDVVPFSNALDLNDIYNNNETPVKLYPYNGYGHGLWGITYEGKHIEKLAFDFMVVHQDLKVE